MIGPPSPSPVETGDKPASTLAEVLLERYADSQGRPFISFGAGIRLTYDESIGRAASFVMALRSAGLQQGDRVLFALDNDLAFIDAWFGCALAGFVMVPLNTLLTGHLLADVVRRSNCRAVIAHDIYVEALEGLTADYSLRLTVKTDRDPHPAGFAGGVAYETVSGTGAAPVAAQVKPGDPMSIMFTSGTTGPAKGVILSQAHCVARSNSYREGLSIDSNDVMYTCLPLFHNNAQMASVLVAVLARARVHIESKFSVSNFWMSVCASGATRFTLIGRMANLLLAAPEVAEERRHHMRSACIVPHPNGGDAFAKRFGVPVISQYYGCTEMIPLAPRIGQERRIGSCGVPTPDFDCRIVDSEGRQVPDGEVGELVARPLRPEGVMTGYLDMPQETLQAFRGLWYHTGDAARRDADGFFYLVGRMKDFIRRKGENISASDVENALNDHPQVSDCAAVGEADEWGRRTSSYGSNQGQVLCSILKPCADIVPSVCLCS